MDENFSIKAILSAVDQGFTSTLDAASAKANSFASGAKITMQDVGTAMTVAGAATTALGVSSIKSFGTFEQSLNQAAVVAGGTAKDIGQLDELANKMGADLPLSAQDCADAMIEMARNGASISDIKQQFPAIAQAATAAGSDIKATAGVVQEAMNIWGKSLDSPQQAAAILVQTANASNASVEDMQQALATIGGTASSAGMNLQTTSEAIGLLTNRGFSAAQASMDLNHAILQMQAPSKVAQNAMQDLGISFTDAQGQMKKFPDILRELNQALNGLNPDEKAQKLKAMFGTAGMQAIVPLLDSVKNKTNDAKVSWDAYAKEQEKAAGSTKQATKTLQDQANEMQKNVGSSIEQLGGNWESLRNTSMKSAQDINGSLIQNANQLLQWATTSNTSTAQFIRGFIGLSPVIGAATTSVGAFILNAQRIAGTIGGGITAISNFIKTANGIAQVASGAKTAEEALGTLAKSSRLASAAMAILNSTIWANPITWIVAGIAAVVAALALFFTQTKTGRQLWSSFITWLRTAWNGLVSVASRLWNSILKSLRPVINQLRALWNAFIAFFRALWTRIAPVVTTAWNQIRARITLSMRLIQVAIRTGMAIIRTVFSNGWRILTTVVSSVWNIITTVVTAGLRILTDIFKAGTALLRGDWSGAWDAIKDIASTVWNTIKSVVQTGISAVQSIVSSVMNAVKGVFSSIWNAIKDIFQDAADSMKRIMSNVNLFDIGKNIVQGLIDGIKSMIGSVGSAIGDISNTVVSSAKGLLGIHSPSTVMRDEVGQWIPAGIAEGINSNIYQISDAAQKATDAAIVNPPKIKFDKIDFPNIDSTQFSDKTAKLNNLVRNQIEGNIAINSQNDKSSIGALSSKLDKLISKDTTMVLDTGQFVGATAQRYDTSLGRISADKSRWT